MANCIRSIILVVHQQALLRWGDAARKGPYVLKILIGLDETLSPSSLSVRSQNNEIFIQSLSKSTLLLELFCSVLYFVFLDFCLLIMRGIRMVLKS
ncbi:hypothetical protein VTL71DRAFT_15020, partial [Oculimacula yallundae]